MGQMRAISAVFGTIVPTLVSSELTAAGDGAAPYPVAQMTGGPSVPVCAPHAIFGHAADVQTLGARYISCLDSTMTGGAICAQMRAPQNLPRLWGDAVCFVAAPHCPTFFGGRI
jgi:hypothetical protein